MALHYAVYPVTAFAQNCSLLWCDVSQQAALVDPGGEAAKLLAAVAERGLKLTQILLTHGHLDHVGAAAEIARQQQIPIIGPHREEQFWLDRLPQQSQMFGFDHCPAFTPSQYLAEGDQVMVGQEQLEVRFCPGHTPGHIVFIHHPSAMLWVGDVLFAGSIGRTDFPRGDHATLLASIRNRLLTLDDHYQLVPGHGPNTTIGRERTTNPYLRDDLY